MSKISRIDYFQKHADKVEMTLNLKDRVIRIVDTYRFSFRNLLAKFWTPRGKLIHVFRVKDNNFYDLSCKRNCAFTYALAIKMKWFRMEKCTIPLTRWIWVSNYQRIRFELRNEDSVVRYKDKYHNVIMEKNVLFILGKMPKIIGKFNSLKNLESFGYFDPKIVIERMLNKLNRYVASEKENDKERP